MNALFYLLLTLINLFQFVLIATVVMSWLISFGVINTYNRFVAALWEALTRLTEPVLRPIRNILPNLGGLDLSPVVVLILLQVLKVFIIKDLAAALGVY